MKKAEDRIWDYLDGRDSAEDRSLLEEQLSTDEHFRELFLKSESLHQNLQKLEVAVPSLRFSQNIMDKLPAVRSLATEPLISKRWGGIFASSVMGLIALIFGGSAAVMPAGAAQVRSDGGLLDQFLRLFESIPLNALLLGGTIAICLLSLLLLDRWLQTRFQR